MLHRRAVLTAGVALLTFFVFAQALFELPSLPDTDSYYHLAVAKLYASDGLVRGLEWARHSAMHATFGDKEILFHVLLIPFTNGDPAAGGRLAIALWNAALAGVITWIAVGACGPWGALIAPLLYLSAPYFWIRTMRLRPELLSVLLFILIAAATAKRRVWTIAVLSAALTLGHTAFHVMAAMAAMWLVITRVVDGRWEWKPALAAWAGIAAGILAHPHFPDNLSIWYLQNVRLLQWKSRLDVGAEIHAPRIADLLANNAGWWLAIVTALLIARPWRTKPSRATAIFSSSAAVFLILQLMMERMSTYFMPFATLAVAFACAEVVWRRSLVAIGAVIGIVAILASAPFAMGAARALAHRMPQDIEGDYAAFGSRIPAGAKVAARWGATDAYVFFAPRARFLNVLDPVFMAAANPPLYQAQRRMFEGREPDVPFVAGRILDSDFIAFSRWETPPAFTERVRNDPRLIRVYDGYNVLLRIQPSDAFITDWNGDRHQAPGLEGFVDADRMPAAPCTKFTRSLSGPMRLELAPWGPSRLWLDGELRVEIRAAPLAILGRGTIIETGNAREVTIETCRAGERSGFYLVQR